jgi:hypothetical protein
MIDQCEYRRCPYWKNDYCELHEASCSKVLGEECPEWDEMKEEE